MKRYLVFCLFFGFIFISCGTVNNLGTQEVRIMSHRDLGIHEDTFAYAVSSNLVAGRYRTRAVTNPWDEEPLEFMLAREAAMYLSINLFLTVDNDQWRLFRVNIIKGNTRYIVYVRADELTTSPEIYPIAIMRNFSLIVFEVL